MKRGISTIRGYDKNSVPYTHLTPPENQQGNN